MEKFDALKKERVIRHLSAAPGDYAGAADAAGYTPEEFEEVVSEHKVFFSRIEKNYRDKLESLCRLAALGKPMPLGYEGFRLIDGMRMLKALREREKPERKPRGTPVRPGVRRDEGTVTERVKAMFMKMTEEDEDEAVVGSGGSAH